jgi:hypothetical protein
MLRRLEILVINNSMYKFSYKIKDTLQGFIAIVSNRILHGRLVWFDGQHCSWLVTMLVCKRSMATYLTSVAVMRGNTIV